MDDVLISFGGGIEAKSVGEGLTELRGPCVIFDAHEGGAADLVKEYFAADSYFGPSVVTGKTAEFEATFNHGVPTHENLQALADYEFKNPVKTEVTDAGVMASLLLDEREEYEKMLAEFARKNPGKLGWSTATAAHRAKREKKSDGRTWIKRWPVVEIAVTHKPCEPRTSAAVSLKSFAESFAPRNAKGLFKEKLSEQTPSTWQLESTFRDVVREIANAARSTGITGAAFDVQAAVRDALAEYSETMLPLVVTQIAAYAEGESSEPFYLKSLLDEFIASGSELVSDSDLDGHSQAVVSAVAEFARKGEAMADPLKAWVARLNDKQKFRTETTKAGRVLSANNRDSVQAGVDEIEGAVSALQQIASALRDLLERAEPKKPESMKALRMQTLRLESRAAGVPLRRTA